LLVGEEALAKLPEALEGAYVIFLGSRLRGDDAAGLLAGEELLSLCPRARASLCEAQLELCLRELRGRAAKKLLVVDAVDAGLEPGSFALLPLAEARPYLQLSTTHGLAPGLLLKLLEQEYGVGEAWVLGIQVKELGGVGEEPSGEVKAAASRLARALLELLPECAEQPRRGGSEP